MAILLGVAFAATALGAGYLVIAYWEWERKNAPRRTSGYSDWVADEGGGNPFSGLLGGDDDGDCGD